MSRSLEELDLAELEQRLAAARQLRRDELLPWLGQAWHELVAAVTGPGTSGSDRAPRDRALSRR
jgi:hypothetical protein